MESVYDRALAEVGQDGSFQKSFDIIFNTLLVGCFSMVYMNLILVLAIAPHNCKIPNKPKNFSESLWKTKFIPVENNAAGESKFSRCLIYDYKNKTNITIGCDEYEYDHTWYHSTVPSDYDWVCDKEIYIANVFAYTKIGEMIGSVISGSFGDIYGRRMCYAVSLAMIIAGRSITVMSGGSFIVFVIGCVVASFPSWSPIQSVAAISLEISSSKRRTVANTLRSVATSLGICLMPLFYWWLRDWKKFVMVTTATHIPFLLLSWHLIESPRWLWLEGKTRDCIQELKKIASKNKRILTKETEDEILTTPASDLSQSMGPLGLFSNCTIAINTFLVSFLWISLTLSYTVLLMSIGSKDDKNKNPFLEFAWQSAAEIPGNFVGAWLSDKIGRRYSGFWSFLGTAGIWILFAIRTTSTSDWSQSWWIDILLSSVMRFLTTVTYYAISMFNMELYPTCLRQSGMALSNVVSSGASAISPYIIYLGRHVDVRLKGVILCGTSALGALCSLLLPETLNAKLPETIEDARNFKKGKNAYFSLRVKK